MIFCKSLCFSVSFVLIFAAAAFSQQRPRIVPKQPTGESQPINQPLNPIAQKPALTNRIVIQNPPALVKKTVSSKPINTISSINTVGSYSPGFSQKLLKAIQIRVGVPYLYGSSGPNAFDCSGLVWSVFLDAGFPFERTSAKTLWQNSVPVEGDDRYKFGTLVFFNKLGHIGIVFDDSGFYHASSSQGVTYSRFDGYWAKRIVGYRRIYTGK
ncbi:MAG: C40 family peptidase [Pyrinomonadaceae bacterium]|nr:C40 family peptidase [Pyrinomonadaceae bacterium]